MTVTARSVTTSSTRAISAEPTRSLARFRSALSPSAKALVSSLLASGMLAGCSAAFADGGPLSDDGTPGSLCGTTPKDGVLSDGYEALTNTAGSAVRIDKISLADAHGLRIIAAY